MNKTDFLPLGSVVILKGGVQKVIIVARGLVAKLTGDPVFFDYGGVLYPQGLVGENIMYFNSEDIRLTVFEGFKDSDDALMTESIQEWMATSPFDKGNTMKIKEEWSDGRHH